MKNLITFIIVASSLLGVEKINAQVAVGVSVGIAPPALPVYAQPPCPTDGYLWSPGYWAYGSNGYYWVPGVWVAPPEVGFLWTPGYWGFVNGGYFWHGGYWGPHVGFYGGVCYGYGYGGTGFYGGRWEGGRFAYNTAAWHVGPGFHSTYEDRSVIHNAGSRSSFNGRGGVMARPSAAEQSAMAEHHIQATSAQQSHARTASMNIRQRASVNGGHPSTTARSTVGGQRYTPAGHSIATTHAATARPATHANASSQHAAARSRATAPQHSAAPARAAQPQHSAAPRGGAPRQGGGGGGGRGRR